MNESLKTLDRLQPGGLAQQHIAAPEADVTTRPWARMFNGMAHTLPAVFVLAALSGLAYWGHHTGWSLPPFSALTAGTLANPDDWCAEHAVPESVCVECNPQLMGKPKDYGWCRAHGVHNCPLEHPEIAQLSAAPQVSPDDRVRAHRALALAERPENNNKCKLYLRRIQFASEEAFQRAGVEVEPVWRGPVTEFVSANGEISYDQTRVARLSPRAAGTVWRVDKKVGDPVRQGEVVALIEAAEVGRAKGEFLQALTNNRLKGQVYERLRGAGAGVAERQVREAEAAFHEAEIRLVSARQALVNLGLPLDPEGLTGLSVPQIAAHLQLLGLPEPLRQALDPRTTTANLLPVKAPLDGVVVTREVVAGEVVDTTRVLLVVADVRRMWLTLSVRQEDAARVALGQQVHFRPDGAAAEVSGSVAWISTAVDHRTRTFKVRADLANPDGQLWANAFGKGRIVLRQEKDAIVVPSEAVHWEGDCHIVFVRDRNFLAANSLKVFHTRTVRLGVKDARNTEVIAGVLPGEVVATRGSGTLRAELLKNNLGEG